MFIKLINFNSIYFLSSFVNGSKQDKLKIVISCLALGVLLLGGAYWVCSRFWSARRVRQSSVQKQTPSPIENKNQKILTPPKAEGTDSEDNQRLLRPHEVISEEDENLPLSHANKVKKDEVLIQQEEVLEDPKPIDAIGSSPTSTVTATKVSICITTPFEAGFVGKDIHLIPYISQFKLEDKSPIPLQEKDLLLTFHCFDSPDGLNLPCNFYLPKTLFANKKEGDFLRLYYNDQLLELYFHQNQHDLKFQEGTFEFALKLAEDHCQTDGRVVFGHYSLYHWYHVDGGTVFKPKCTTQNSLQLLAVSADQFRPLQGLIDNALNIEELKLDFVRKDEGDYFMTNLVGFDATSPDDLDRIQFVLNDQTLAIHALREQKIDQWFAKKLKREDDLVKDGVSLDEQKEEDHPNNPHIMRREISDEYIVRIQWKKIFEDITLEQMQKKLENARLILEFGVLQIFFPRSQR
jgi:hypothetical protein